MDKGSYFIHWCVQVPGGFRYSYCSKIYTCISWWSNWKMRIWFSFTAIFSFCFLSSVRREACQAKFELQLSFIQNEWWVPADKSKPSNFLVNFQTPCEIVLHEFYRLKNLKIIKRNVLNVLWTETLKNVWTFKSTSSLIFFFHFFN